MARTETVPPGVSDRWAPYPFAYNGAKYATFTDDALAFALRDARAAAVAMRGMGTNRDGCSPEGWYTDDAATIAAEIARRTFLKGARRAR